jgi:hypothetical protein
VWSCWRAAPAGLRKTAQRRTRVRKTGQRGRACGKTAQRRTRVRRQRNVGRSAVKAQHSGFRPCIVRQIRTPSGDLARNAGTAGTLRQITTGDADLSLGAGRARGDGSWQAPGAQGDGSWQAPGAQGDGSWQAPGAHGRVVAGAPRRPSAQRYSRLRGCRQAAPRRCSTPRREAVAGDPAAPVEGGWHACAACGTGMPCSRSLSLRRFRRH